MSRWRTAYGMTILASVVAGAMPARAAPREVTAAIANMSFGRLPSDLKVGDTVIWVNKDSVPHTVTARDRSFDLRLNPGQKIRQTLRKAGNFPIVCTLHSPMRAALKVAAN